MVEGGYLTSSATVNLIIEERGLESFVVRKIKTFDEGPKALDYDMSIPGWIRTNGTGCSAANLALNHERPFALPLSYRNN